MIRKLLFTVLGLVFGLVMGGVWNTLLGGFNLIIFGICTLVGGLAGFILAPARAKRKPVEYYRTIPCALQRCKWCGGRGRGGFLKRPCKVCGGQGYVMVVQPAHHCPRCHGTGKGVFSFTKCKGCEGSGWTYASVNQT